MLPEGPLPPVNTPPPVTSSPSPLFYLGACSWWSPGQRLPCFPTIPTLRLQTSALLPPMAGALLHGVLGPSSSVLTPRGLSGLFSSPLWTNQSLGQISSTTMAWWLIYRAASSSTSPTCPLFKVQLQLPLTSCPLFTALLATPRPFLAQFPELVGSDFADLNPKHGVEHHVETSGPLIFAKPQRLDAQKLAVAKAEFLKMEEAGIIRQSTSAWASSLHMVPKPNGSWCPCGNNR